EQQQLVLLLRHASTCCDGAAGRCRSAPLHCRSAAMLSSHIAACKEGPRCGTPHCCMSRIALSHWGSCTDASCSFCGPLRE
ncbi:unnamed protein product, partial [Phaeothamnion confervicola]